MMKKENNFGSLRSKVKWYFDSTFSEKSTAQLAWLVGIIVFVFALVLLFSYPFSEKIIENGTPSMSRPIRIISLLINPGAVSEVDEPMRGFAIVVAVIGIIILSGFLITVLTNMLERHVDKYKNGDIHYKLKNHILIIGFNDFTIPLIKEIFAANDNEKILLVSTEAPSLIKDILEAELTPKERINTIFYSESYTISKSVSLFDSPQAKRIYIIGDRHDKDIDSSNMKCLEILVNCHLQINSYKATRCYIFFNSFAIRSVLKLKGLRPEWEKALDIIPVNFEESWARNILIKRFYKVKGENYDYPKLPLFEIAHSDDEAKIHWIISGMTSMGNTLGEMIARLIHIPHSSEGKRSTIITFLDENADEKMEDFISTHSAFFEEQSSIYIDSTKDKIVTKVIGGSRNFLDVTFEFVKGSFMNLNTRKHLAEVDTKYLFVAICDESDDLCYKKAINLPQKYYSDAVPVYVRQSSSLSILMTKDVDKFWERHPDWEVSKLTNKFANLYPFGMKDDIQFLAKNDDVFIVSTIIKYAGKNPDPNISFRSFIEELTQERLVRNPNKLNTYYSYLYDGFASLLLYQSLVDTDNLDEAKHILLDREYERLKITDNQIYCVNSLLSGFRYSEEGNRLWFTRMNIKPLSDYSQFDYQLVEGILEMFPDSMAFLKNNYRNGQH